MGEQAPYSGPVTPDGRVRCPFTHRHTHSYTFNHLNTRSRHLYALIRPSTPSHTLKHPHTPSHTLTHLQSSHVCSGTPPPAFVEFSHMLCHPPGSHILQSHWLYSTWQRGYQSHTVSVLLSHFLSLSDRKLSYRTSLSIKVQHVTSYLTGNVCVCLFFRTPTPDHWALASGLPTYVAESGFVSSLSCSHTP